VLIEINLLPQSYFKAKRLKKIIVLAVLGVIVVVAVMVGLYTIVLAQLSTLNNEIKKVETRQQEFIKTLNEIDNMKKTKAQVDEYLGVITDLKDRQVLWPLILDSFNKTVPSNIWINALNNKPDAGGVRSFNVVGVGLFKESVADFVSNLNDPAGFFKNASLVSMAEAIINGRASYNFTISFQTIEETKIKPPRQMSIGDVGSTGIYGNNYINVEHGCSISAPDGWKINDKGLSSNVLLVMTKEKRDIKSRFTPLVTVSVEKVTDEKFTAKQMQEINQKKYSNWPGYRKLGEKEFTINGEKVYDLEFNWQTKGTKDKSKALTLRQRQIYHVKKDQGFVITCSDVEDTFSENKDEFGIIFNSFKVKEVGK